MTTGGAPHFGGVAPPSDPARLARLIVSAPRFHYRITAPAPKPWYAPLTSWLADRWNALLHAFAGHVGGGTMEAFGDVMLAAVALGLVLVVIRLLSRSAWRREGIGEVQLRATARRANAAALFTAAQAAADGGDYALAIPLLYRASLCVLDVRGAVRDDPSATVTDTREQIRRRAAAALPPFERLAQLFLQVVFGDARVERPQWLAAADAYADLARYGDAET